MKEHLKEKIYKSLYSKSKEKYKTLKKFWKRKLHVQRDIIMNYFLLSGVKIIKKILKIEIIKMN